MCKSAYIIQYSSVYGDNYEHVRFQMFVFFLRKKMFFCLFFEENNLIWFKKEIDVHVIMTHKLMYISGNKLFRDTCHDAIEEDLCSAHFKV